MEDKIKIMFHCPKCDVKDEVTVSKREASEDILHFTERVAQACGLKHNLRSPVCGATTVDLYLPIPPRGMAVGSAVLGREATPEELKEWRDAVNQKLKKG